MNGVGWHTDNLCRLCNDRVNLAIDPDAPIPASLARLFWEPVVPVPALQHLDDGDFEPFKLRITAGVPSAN